VRGELKLRTYGNRALRKVLVSEIKKQSFEENYIRRSSESVLFIEYHESDKINRVRFADL
jgi:hypothetical protein